MKNTNKNIDVFFLEHLLVYALRTYMFFELFVCWLPDGFPFFWTGLLVGGTLPFLTKVVHGYLVIAYVEVIQNLIKLKWTMFQIALVIIRLFVVY